MLPQFASSAAGAVQPPDASHCSHSPQTVPALLTYGQVAGEAVLQFPSVAHCAVVMLLYVRQTLVLRLLQSMTPPTPHVASFAGMKVHAPDASHCSHDPEQLLAEQQRPEQAELAH